MDITQERQRRMTFDDLLGHIGGAGWYQAILFAIHGIFSLLSVESIFINFVAAEVPHWCQVPELVKLPFEVQKNVAIPSTDRSDYASTDSFSKCLMFNLNYSAYAVKDFLAWNRSVRVDTSMPIQCKDGWTYDHSQFANTIVSDWNLVCTEQWLVPLVSTAFIAGQFLGGVTSGLLADKFGRLPILVLCCLFKFGGGLFSAFAPNYITLLLAKAINGVGSVGSYLVAFILMVEVSSGPARTLSGMGFMLSFSLGFMLIPLYAHQVRDWRKVQIIMAGPAIIGLAFWWILPESPRWLLINGRFKEAGKVIKRIADINGTKVPDHMDLSQISMDEDRSKTVQKSTIIDAFRRPVLRKWIIISLLHWFTDSLVYYALSLNSGNLAGDIFLNTFLLGLIEIPANLLCIFFLEWPPMGRRRTASFSLLFAGGTALLTIPFLITNVSPLTVTALAVLGKAGATMGFSTIYVYSGELFPTEVRNVAIGLCSACARMSGMMAPFIGGLLGNVWQGLPFLIYGIFGLVTGGLTLLLPETLNRGLFDTMEEAEQNLAEKCPMLRVEAPVQCSSSWTSSIEAPSSVTKRKTLSTPTQQCSTLEVSHM